MTEGGEKKPKRKYVFSPAGLAKRQASNSKRFEDPEYRARHAKRTVKALEKRWDDPGFRERHSIRARESMIAIRNTPTFAERQLAGVQTIWQKPGYREKMLVIQSDSQKRRWAVPDGVPKGYERVYRSMVKEVGAERALPIVQRLAQKETLA